MRLASITDYSRAAHLPPVLCSKNCRTAVEVLIALDIEVVLEPELTVEDMEAWRPEDSRALAVEDRGKPEDRHLADSWALEPGLERRNTAVVTDRE